MTTKFISTVTFVDGQGTIYEESKNQHGVILKSNKITLSKDKK